MALLSRDIDSNMVTGWRAPPPLNVPHPRIQTERPKKTSPEPEADTPFGKTLDISETSPRGDSAPPEPGLAVVIADAQVATQTFGAVLLHHAANASKTT
jgi:hypothetical protein